MTDNSFFEYRDETGVESDSDTEIIENSIIEESFNHLKKTPAKNKNTVLIAESDESVTDDDSIHLKSKSVARRSSAAQSHIIPSTSDDDDSTRGSIRQQSATSPNRMVLSSSDEDDASPELVPRRRPPYRPKPRNSDESVIGRKTKKRMLTIDSDTENSIIIEHNNEKKLVCVKDTPLKIVAGNREFQKINNMCNVDGTTKNDSDSTEDASDKTDDENENTKKDPICTEDEESDDSDGLKEDNMVMSRATRMSIMGVMPKDNDSDDSDYILSDDTQHSKRSNTSSISELPDAGLSVHRSPTKLLQESLEADTSRLSCSPFTSPAKDPDETVDVSTKHDSRVLNEINNVSLNLRESEMANLKSRIASNLSITENKENDDDVTVVESVPEIIDLSSDEDEVIVKKSPASKKTPRKSPVPKKSPVRKVASSQSSISQYLVPASYPNQVVYVRRRERDAELQKLTGLREDLKNVASVLHEMELESLPDGGAKLLARMEDLEGRVKEQAERVAHLEVISDEEEDEVQVVEDVSAKGLTWDDIQKGSNAVQPRMFGKQAMATHMAERSHILERLRDLHESLGSRPPETELATSPTALRSALMPHQLHALAWLRWRETQRPPGGILADDMGLGKTITMISLIAGDIEKTMDDDDDDEPVNSKLVQGGTLVVCPASLIEQWSGEVVKHCRAGALSVCQHHGAARASQPHRLAAHHMVVTTYHLLQRDLDKKGVLMRVRWRRVILDEAHMVRNHKSVTSAAVCALAARARWCLTGTPVHNKDLDLFALLKFLRCSPFDDLTMWKKWIDNKSLGGQERLSTVMRCILLRRTKQQLQQRGQLNCLPERASKSLEVTLTTEEMNVYQKVLVLSKTLFAQFLHQRAEKAADSGGQTSYDNVHKRMVALQGAKPVKSHEILVLLLRLRQVCCHCGLIAAMLRDDAGDADVREDPAGQDLLAELNKLSLDEATSTKSVGRKEEEEDAKVEGTTAAEAIRSVLSPNNPVFDLRTQSSKIAAVMDCLQQNVFNTGDKAVVVSQWTSVLALVERELSVRRVRSVTLSGAVPVPQRPALISALNDPASNIKVMLLSLSAGGVGLNLCGANHLLLLDPHWNPQLEEQAQDRVYRVGQTRPVTIYRFMCVDTVEQTIRKLQEAKLQLAQNVLTGARHTESKLSIEDLKMLFNMGT